MGWVRRLRATFSRAEGDFDEERRFHIEERTDEYVRSGMSQNEARRTALRALRQRGTDEGADAGRRSVPRDSRPRPRCPVCVPHAAAQPGLFAAGDPVPHARHRRQRRRLQLDRRHPAASVSARRRPGPAVRRHRHESRRARQHRRVVARLARSAAQQHAGRGVHRAKRSPGPRSASATAPSARSGSMVSANYFDAIGVRPMLGRGFEPGEDAGRNAHPVTVISYQMWQDRFRGDPAIIGKTQLLSGLPHTIVGVAPKGFYGTFVGYAFQFWVPASMQSQFDAGVYKLEDRGARWIEGYVRLKPGVTIEQAQDGDVGDRGAPGSRTIPRPTAAAASGCSRCGRRRSTTPARCCRRSASRSSSSCRCCSSPARTSATCCWSGRSRGSRR